MSRAAAAALRFPEVSPFSPEVDGIDPGDELLDVVDEQDRVVGQATRREVRRRRLLHRFSSVFCRDPAGRLYVHRRTDDKDVYPGMYDMTAGGVLAAGETYLEAARRELAEELGVAGPEPRYLFHHRYHGQENPSWSAAVRGHLGRPRPPPGQRDRLGRLPHPRRAGRPPGAVALLPRRPGGVPALAGRRLLGWRWYWRMWSRTTRPPISTVPLGPGRALITEPWPWWTVIGCRAWWASSIDAEPQASSSWTPMRAANTRARTMPLASSSHAQNCVKSCLLDGAFRIEATVAAWPS